MLLSRYPDAVHAHAGAGPFDHAVRQVDRIRHHPVEVPLRAAGPAAGGRRGLAPPRAYATEASWRRNSATPGGACAIWSCQRHSSE